MAAARCCCGTAALGPRKDRTRKQAYRKGSLKFRLDGEKLHGAGRWCGWAARPPAKARENWLLIKERDELAVPGSDTALVDENPLSVATGRSMDAIAADRDRVWDSRQGEIAAAIRRSWSRS